jgi:hypothetical protein
MDDRRFSPDGAWTNEKITEDQKLLQSLNDDEDLNMESLKLEVY